MIPMATDSNTNRLASIDLLRGLTMILMIFVNDLWTVRGVPQWMLHVAPKVDGIGLSDIVFPAFLFIVGLSLPLAIDARRKKAQSDTELVVHVISRAFALIVMGLFLVNGEYINATATGMSRQAWYVICCLCFILIRNAYPANFPKKWSRMLQAAGILTLIVMAYIYRGGKDEEPTLFRQHWWGILGLIGWAYLAAGLITVASRGKIAVVAAAWVFFSCLSMLHHAKIIPASLYTIPEPIIGGTLTALVLGGVLTMMVFRAYAADGQYGKLYALTAAAIVILCVLSVITRPYWGLAKLGATPAWLFLCSAFTLIGLLIVHWITDIKGKANWLSFAKPAGTDTLLTYLMPYFAYAIAKVSGLALPDILLTGGAGLLKCLAFALLCVWMTRMLSAAGVRLRL
jgi:predicted acyltransferase